MLLPAPPAPMAAIPSDAFADSVAVALHLNYLDTPYGRFESRVLPALRELGVRHVRDGASDDPLVLARFRKLGTLGIRTTMIFQGDSRSKLRTVAKALGPALEAVEGPNEPDLPQFNFSYGGKRYPEASRAYQQDLYGWVKSDPLTKRTPVILASMGWGKNAETQGDLSAFGDYGSAHWYTADADAPGSALDGWHLRYSRVIGPGLPLWCTETGYSTATDGGGISEAAHARYVPRLLLEHFRRGVVRTTIYELQDEWDRPKSEGQAHYGLVRFDGTRKPAFAAVRNLVRLTSDRGIPHQPKPLPLTIAVEGNDPLVHWILLGRRDGRYRLALWRDAKAWDPKAKRDLPDLATPVRLTLPRLARWREFLPAEGTKPLWSRKAATVAVAAGGHPRLIEIAP